MLERLKRLFTPRRDPRPADLDPHLDYGDESGAHPSDQRPEELHRGRRRLKETYTSHWDLDYLSREEMERILRKNRDGD